MADAPVIVTGSNADTPHVGKVFDGISFFLVQRMPSRSRYLKEIEANGGRVVKVETQADYVIADHMRKDAPAGSFSYEFIETALKDGQLPDPSTHAIRPPGSVRYVGSTTMGKATRTPFTIEDDQLLWNTVQQAKAAGGHLKGNELYKGIEAINPRHTWQSWRDRYVKTLQNRPPRQREPTVAANPPPSPPTEETVVPPARTFEDFDKSDFNALMGNADDIELIPPEKWMEAWTMFAKANTKDSNENQPNNTEEDQPEISTQAEPKHSAEDWIEFYQQRVRPVHLKRKAERERRAEQEREAERNHPRSDVREQGSATKKRKQLMDQESPQRDRSKKQRTATPEVNGSPKRKTAHRSQSREPLNVKFADPVESSDMIENDGETLTRTRDRRSAEPMVTSDLNAAAGVQLQQEADVDRQVPQRPAQMSEHQNNHVQNLRSEAEVPNSEANRAAEAQFGDWRAQVGDADHERGSDENGQDVQLSEGPVLEPPDNSRHALTEANLASQQAQHEPPIIRGTDLLEDDQDKDQTTYAEYLQSTLGVAVGNHGRAPSHSRQEDEQGNANAQEADLRSRSDREEPDAYPPLSSPQEVDDALEDGLNWPASPQRRRMQNERQELQPEPRALYPLLPSHSGHDYELPTQALISQLDEASSPNQRGSASQTHDDEEEIVFPDFDDLVNGDANEDDEYDEPQQVDDEDGAGDGENGYNLGDDEDDGDDGDDDEIDLAVPEPDGGFEAPTSPHENGSNRDASPEEDAEARSQSVVVISSRQSSSSLEEEEDSIEASRQPRRAGESRRNHVVETQDILNAETQLPDLEVPLPFDSDDEFEEDSPRRSQKSVAKNKGKEKAVEAAPLDTAEEVFSWVSTMMVRGYKQAAIIKALRRTSNRPDLALLVLIEEGAGNGFPEDVPGVWSEAEDEMLESGYAPGLAELRDKHGWTEMDARMKFLEDWRSLE